MPLVIPAGDARETDGLLWQKQVEDCKGELPAESFLLSLVSTDT